MPSNQINYIVETNDGKIWINTLGHIAWFDGYQWVKINGTLLPDANSHGIDIGPKDSILVGNSKNIYIGTTQGFRKMLKLPEVHFITSHLNYYVFLDDKNNFCIYNNGVVQILLTNAHQGIQTRSKETWFTADSTLYVYARAKAIPILQTRKTYIEFSAMSENKNKNGVVAINRPPEILGLWEWDSSRTLKRNSTEFGSMIQTLDINDSNNVIVVYKSFGVRIRKENKWYTPKYIPTQLQNCKKIRFTQNGDFWLSTDNGMYLFRNTHSLWSHYKQPRPSLLDNINDILLNLNGELWLATGSGLLILEPNGLQREISSIDGKTLYAVTGLAQDNDGNVWISSGSTFSGAYKWNGKQWQHYAIGNEPENTMFHKIVRDKQGNLWFLGLSKTTTTNEHEPGVFLYKNNQFIHWSKEHQLPNKRVYSFAEGLHNDLWFGTKNGIYRWRADSTANGSWQTWLTPIYLPIFTMVIDTSGFPWFGHGFNSKGMGLGTIRQDGKIRYLTTDDGLIENHVNELAFDSKGRLWITTSGGLSSYANGAWKTFGVKTGLTYPALWPIKVFSEKIIVGTLGNGLAILNTKGISSSPPPRIILNQPIVDGTNVLLRWQAFAFLGELPRDEILTRYRINKKEWSPWSTSRSLSLNNLDPEHYTFEVQARGLYGQFFENGNSASFLVLPPLWARPVFFIPVALVSLSFISLVVNSYLRKRRSDAELRKSEEKFRAVAQTAPSPIFIYTPRAITYANPAAIQLTGFTLDELCRLNFQDLFHPMFRHVYFQTYQSQQIARHKEVKIIRKDGYERWIELTTCPIAIQGGTATLGAVFDITERKENELQMRALTFELSRTEERERRRLATYLHDTISQNLAFLKLRFRNFTKSLGISDENTAVAELKEIIESIILDSQTLTFELSPPILHELGLEAAINWLCEKTEDQHGISSALEFKLNGKLLPFEIQQMTFNTVRELVANIIKHAEAKEINIAILATAESFFITVRDNGKGFTVEQLQPQKQKRGGFGLANIKQWVTTLGGTFQVLPDNQGGSTVTISLPATYLYQTEGAISLD